MSGNLCILKTVKRYYVVDRRPPTDDLADVVRNCVLSFDSYREAWDFVVESKRPLLYRIFIGTVDEVKFKDDTFVTEQEKKMTSGEPKGIVVDI